MKVLRIIGTAIFIFAFMAVLVGLGCAVVFFVPYIAVMKLTAVPGLIVAAVWIYVIYRLWKNFCNIPVYP